MVTTVTRVATAVGTEQMTSGRCKWAVATERAARADERNAKGYLTTARGKRLKAVAAEGFAMVADHVANAAGRCGQCFAAEWALAA